MASVSSAPNVRLAGLPPVIALDTRVIVLGSFPGAASLAAGQYYAHPRNQFWRLISAVVGEDLAALPYSERLARLLAHRFGLWDVLGACEREGSLDASIRNAQANDFALLRARCPELQALGFNGQASGKFARQFSNAGFRAVVLPSSSPAHASMTFQRKLEAWLALKG